MRLPHASFDDDALDDKGVMGMRETEPRPARRREVGLTAGIWRPA